MTLEPCPMCSGAIINSRIKRVVYGAADVKAGCCGSVTDLFAQPFNHHPVIEKGLRADEAQQLLQEFFVSLRARRAAKPRWKPPVTPESVKKWELREKSPVTTLFFARLCYIIQWKLVETTQMPPGAPQSRPRPEK